MKVACDTYIPKNCQNFLCDANNKTALFSLIADTLQSINPFIVTIFLTKQDRVLSNQSSDLSLISPCVQEQAGTRLLLHVSNCNGTSVMKTVDSVGLSLVLKISHINQFMVLYINWMELLARAFNLFMPLQDVKRCPVSIPKAK